MKQLNEEPTKEEEEHLLRVLQNTCGPFNEVTRILERLIHQRNGLMERQPIKQFTIVTNHSDAVDHCGAG